jgi:putative Mg2+ transporter-C (MgtC) family protein
MPELDPLTLQFWYEIGVSLLCGSIIGLERELRGKPTGMRTCVLICLGTALFVRIGTSFPSAHADPTRVIGQVVTGIGFLGAGVIMARGEMVRGVTTAAVVWLLAAIGAMIGASQFKAAIAISILAVVILIGIEQVEKRVGHLRGHDRDSQMPHHS